MEYQNSFSQNGYQSMSYSTNFINSSKIDSLNASAKAIIAQKDAEIEELNRKITKNEYKKIENFLYSLNLENGYIQEMGKNEENYVPIWKINV